jgi:alanyl-tRNA synthetase
VVYALRAIEPSYWENMVRGERVEDEERAELSSETWENITTTEVRRIVNEINKNSSNLKDLNQQHVQLTKQLEAFEVKTALTNAEGVEFENVRMKTGEISERLSIIKQKLQPFINQLVRALKNESEEVQIGFVPFLRFLNADLTDAEWAKKTRQTGGGKDPLTQTLLLLGIRKQDIEGDEPENWKLLLPEERMWLRQLLQ